MNKIKCPYCEKQTRDDLPHCDWCLKTFPRHPSFTPRVNQLIGNPASDFVAGCREIERELDRVRDGVDKIEELTAAGAYLKWQDQAWWMFWESSGEVAAGPAKSLYDLALILSNIGIGETDTTGKDANP